MFKKIVALLPFFFIFQNYAYAETEAPPVPAALPTHPPMQPYLINGFTVTGYAAGAYNYLSRSEFFTSGSHSRLYDLDQNGLIFHQLSLTVAKQPVAGFGGLFDLTLGRDSYGLASYGLRPGFGSQNAGLDLTQVYAQYAIKSWTFIAGKFNSLAGYESNLIPQNSNYSTSLVATFAEPTTHTGVRATYALNDSVSLFAGINNGWDNIRDTSRRKTIELSAAYIGEKYNFSAALYNGQERVVPQTSTGPLGIKTLLDLVASVKVTDKLTLVANYDGVTQSKAALANGTLGRAVWQGLAGYVQYQINEKWRASLRGEYFTDPDGFATGVNQNIREATLTFGYLVTKHFELRAETRHDVSNRKSFLDKNGVTASNNMQSFALEGVVTL